MKDRVNFLRGLKAQEVFKNRARQGILIFGILLAGLIACRYAVLKHRTGQLAKENTKLESNLNNLRNLQTLELAMQGKADELRNELSGYEEMFDLHQKAGQNRTWSTLLTELASALPPGVWFDRLDVETDDVDLLDGPTTLRVFGKTFSQSELLHFLSRMEVDDHWESATLHRVDRQSSVRKDLPDLYRFELSLNLST